MFALPQRWVRLCLLLWMPCLVVTQAKAIEGGTNQVAPLLDPRFDWKKEREFWAFRAPIAQRRPHVSSVEWPRVPFDFFVLTSLEIQGLTPASEADRRTLFRRVSLDLTGLPPSAQDMDKFLSDPSPQAYERSVERLLASPRMGEHWASLWLPLARFAEDQAHQVGDDTTYFYANAWRYRDWVIGAINRDLPYDQFLTFQLAADRVSAANESDQAALGFLGLGPKYYDRGRLAVQADEWEDRVDTVCRAMLGLTVACARCHDHKFDPIPTADYYAMAGVFASSRMANRAADGREEKSNTPISRIQADTLHLVVEDRPRDLPVFLRGNVERPGPVAERRFLTVLSTDEPARFQSGSGRQELAAAIASRENPLTARVMVNRIWSRLTGIPLVSTPSNFGHSGAQPSHPELLDDLAVRFMDCGWSMKTLIREIVCSSTYRQESSGGNQSHEKSMFSPMSRRRLSIEQWRDTTLFLTGELDATGGVSTDLDDPKNHRRTVYSRISRLKLNDLLMQFDYPDANVHAEKRGQTTTAIQKLFLLNSNFAQERSRALVSRLTKNVGSDDRTRVRQLYRLLFDRDPDLDETELALGFLVKPTTSQQSRWEQYAQLMLASNELLYVD